MIMMMAYQIYAFMTFKTTITYYCHFNSCYIPPITQQGILCLTVWNSPYSCLFNCLLFSFIPLPSKLKLESTITPHTVIRTHMYTPIHTPVNNVTHFCIHVHTYMNTHIFITVRSTTPTFCPTRTRVTTHWNLHITRHSTSKLPWRHF